LKLQRSSLFVVALLAGTLVASASDTRIEAGLVSNPKLFWKAFMTEVYGPYDKLKKCWVMQHEGEDFCMRPHTFETVTAAGGPQYYLTVAGAVSGRPEGNDCHACNGNIGFFVLRPAGEKLAIAAQSEKLLTIGAYGQVPSEDVISVRTIGAGDAKGWVVEVFDMGQGITVTLNQVHAVIGDQVRTIGVLPKSYSNDGTECDTKCTDVQLQATFDTSKPDRFSPVVLRSSGQVNGEIFSKTFVAEFDEKSFSYVLPADVPEELRN
jgi:hypothetical protein